MYTFLYWIVCITSCVCDIFYYLVCMLYFVLPRVYVIFCITSCVCDILCYFVCVSYFGYFCVFLV